jgi:magnesium transporter
MLGAVVTGWAYLLQGNLAIALTVGISLAAISILASTAGGGLPILFDKMGFDPALMSAPFITTIVDVLGVLLYLTLARYMLGLA